MKEEKFDVMGMTCSACVAHVEKAVSKVPGVKKVQVNLLSNNMVVDFEGDITPDIELAVNKAGYEAHLKNAIKQEKTEDRTVSEEKTMLFRWRTSLYFLIPLMYISMGGMMHLPVPAFLDSMEFPLSMGLLQFMLALPIYWLNRKYFTGGYKSLFMGAPNMDSLIGIGSSAALAYGVFMLFKIAYALESGSSGMELGHDVYFESGATILTLITLGKYFEARSKSRTSSAIERLLELRPQSAIKLIDDQEIEIAVEDIQTGDLLVIRSGSQVPVDGSIIKGNGDLDESALTGESMPVFKETGQEVLSATHLRSGYLVIRASRVGENTTLSQIIHLVEEAANSKAPVSRLADKISGVFVPIVIGISLISFIVWMMTGQSFDFALSIAIAVLVISCPCALGLATPVAIMVGTGKSASLGVLFKDAAALEMASKLDTIVFDKTGTLTTGQPVVTDLVTTGFFSKEKLIEIAASLEKPSEHVLAEAILNEADKLKVKLLEVDTVKVYPGKGIEGNIAGREYSIGNEKLMLEKNIDLKSFGEKAVPFASQGKTVLFTANQKEVLGLVVVADVLKESSKALVAELKAMGKHVVMLTGDHSLTAKSIQEEAGIDEMVADVLPGEKEAVIRRLQDEGRKVAMVGDGINDAPALTRADLGIAVGGGTDIAIESADVVLLRHQIGDVLTTLQMGVKVMKHIKQNLFWAFFYNVMGIPLAAGVFYMSMGLKLNPMFAAAAMSVSSVTVVLNALRLNSFKKKELVNDNNTKIKEIKMSEKKMIVEGMSCGHCQMRVEKALNALDGVQAKVDLASKTASVEIEGSVEEETLRKAVEDAGYEVSSIS